MPSFLFSPFLLFFFIPVTVSLNFAVNNSNFHLATLNFNGSASANDEAILLTLENVDLASGQTLVGRATYVRRLHLWDKKSRKLADFHTHFRFEVYSGNNNGSAGDGLAFFMSPVGGTIPDGSDHGGLGLMNPSKIGTNDSLEGNESSSSSFFAVEFDTFPNEWETSLPIPHVGIDINSVNSTKTAQWSNNISAEVDTEAWIWYNASTMNLTVSFTGHPGPESDRNQTHGSISYVVDLRDHLPEYVYLGFSASVGDGYATQKVYDWSFTSTELGGGNGDHLRLILGLSVGMLTAAVVASALAIGWYIKKKAGKKTSSSDDDEEDLIDGPNMDDEFEKGSGPKKFSYKELVHSTNKFSETEKLGEGGFGQVYRGFLAETDSYIAVKRLSGRTHQGLKEYASEVKIISRLRHKNLVQFIGWCHRKGNLLLVYEYMPNGSLDYHLFGGDLIPLSWEMRYKIALGLASALLYLHEECEQCVLHRDVKSSNVMLDSNFNAKLGDFGLARFVDHEKGSQTTLLAGTMGYMAPESIITGRASKESDVYSFGVVLLEIACGKRPIEVANQRVTTVLIEHVWNLYGMGKLLDAADPKLCSDFDAREMETMMVVGLWCVHPDSSFRPMMREAKHVLTCEAPLPVIPRTLPQVMYYTPGSGRMTFTGSSSVGGQMTNTDHCSTSLTTSTSFSLVSPR